MFPQDKASWQEHFQAIDANNDGKIDYDEFMTAAANRVELLNKDNLMLAFKMLDANGDGNISAEEIRTAFSRGNMSSLQNHQVEMQEDFWEVMLNDID